MTPAEKYDAAAEDALAMLSRLSAHILAGRPTNPSWADVARIQDMAKALREISDRAFHEGEFAE